jgi:hypothetical protein
LVASFYVLLKYPLLRALYVLAKYEVSFTAVKSLLYASPFVRENQISNVDDTFCGTQLLEHIVKTDQLHLAEYFLREYFMEQRNKSRLWHKMG